MAGLTAVGDYDDLQAEVEAVRVKFSYLRGNAHAYAQTAVAALATPLRRAKAREVIDTPEVQREIAEFGNERLQERITALEADKRNLETENERLREVLSYVDTKRIVALEAKNAELRAENVKLWEVLQHADGQLGLAVYRGEHDERWKQEAQTVISEIREVYEQYLASTEVKPVPPDIDCYTLPNGECVAPHCRLHGDTRAKP